MTFRTTNASEPPQQVQEPEVDQVLKAAWETAVRRNPMALVNIINPNTAIEHLRRMIRDCLARGLTEIETRDHAVKELFNSAIGQTQPPETCSDSVSQRNALLA